MAEEAVQHSIKEVAHAIAKAQKGVVKKSLIHSKSCVFSSVWQRARHWSK